MEKIKLEIVVSETREEMDLALEAFETFVKKANPKDVTTFFKVPFSQLEIVLATFQDTEVSDSIPYYNDFGSSLLEEVEGYYKHLEVHPKEKIVKVNVMASDKAEEFDFFLKRLCEAAKEKVLFLRKTYAESEKMIDLISKISDCNEKDKYVNADIFSQLADLYKTREDMDDLTFLLAIIMRNQMLLDMEKEKTSLKRIYSTEELQTMKKEAYIKTYGLSLEEDVSLESIEEVIQKAKEVGLCYLQLHPECFLEKKELFLSNIELLKELIPDIKVVVDRNPEALLDKNLSRNLKLISMYAVDFTELLCYQEKALTDLSYFGILDLMIENGYFDLKKLLDKNNVEVKKRTVLRLLGIPNMEIKQTFPLNEDEVDFLLEQKSTILKNGMNLTDKCLLDAYQNGERTYSMNGVLISRPKVLRNIETDSSISIDTVCCNGFFTSEEMNLLIQTIHELQVQYQKKK